VGDHPAPPVAAEAGGEECQTRKAGVGETRDRHWTPMGRLPRFRCPLPPGPRLHPPPRPVVGFESPRHVHQQTPSFHPPRRQRRRKRVRRRPRGRPACQGPRRAVDWPWQHRCRTASLSRAAGSGSRVCDRQRRQTTPRSPRAGGRARLHGQHPVTTKPMAVWETSDGSFS